MSLPSDLTELYAAMPGTHFQTDFHRRVYAHMLARAARGGHSLIVAPTGSGKSTCVRNFAAVASKSGYFVVSFRPSTTRGPLDAVFDELDDVRTETPYRYTRAEWLTVELRRLGMKLILFVEDAEAHHKTTLDQIDDVVYGCRGDRVTTFVTSSYGFDVDELPQFHCYSKNPYDTKLVRTVLETKYGTHHAVTDAEAKRTTFTLGSIVGNIVDDEVRSVPEEDRETFSGLVREWKRTNRALFRKFGFTPTVLQRLTFRSPVVDTNFVETRPWETRVVPALAGRFSVTSLKRLRDLGFVTFFDSCVKPWTKIYPTKLRFTFAYINN